MDTQFKHGMLPEATHDELARQNFIKSLKSHLGKNFRAGMQRFYEQRVKPQFEQEYEREPQNRHEIRQIMEDEPYYQWFSALGRTTQEMLWEAVGSSVERQLPYLMSKAQAQETPLGSLELNPNLPIPVYQKAVDIHCMPGSYYGEMNENDLAAGAIYDRGVYIYGMGWLGPLNDDLGQTAIHHFLKQQYPDFLPRKILDLGCSVGHSTLPYVDAYPDAEVYGIDLAAPMLRYAHARAEMLGKKVYFSQQNAEKTNFKNGSFDLVVSHIILHEMPVPAINNVIKECYRLLAPGGMMLHVEGAMYNHMDAFRQFMYDWETINNNEPFWSAMRDLDLTAVATKAGFNPDKVIQTFVPNGVWLEKENNNKEKQQGFASRGSWFMFAATK